MPRKDADTWCVDVPKIKTASEGGDIYEPRSFEEKVLCKYVCTYSCMRLHSLLARYQPDGLCNWQIQPHERRTYIHGILMWLMAVVSPKTICTCAAAWFCYVLTELEYRSYSLV